MKRIIDTYLAQWKADHNRKPLLLRGARQVGKTYAVRELGKTFDNFIEINFERNQRALTIFDNDKSLDPNSVHQKYSFMQTNAYTVEQAQTDKGRNPTL